MKAYLYIHYRIVRLISLALRASDQTHTTSSKAPYLKLFRQLYSPALIRAGEHTNSANFATIAWPENNSCRKVECLACDVRSLPHPSFSLTREMIFIFFVGLLLFSGFSLRLMSCYCRCRLLFFYFSVFPPPIIQDWFLYLQACFPRVKVFLSSPNCHQCMKKKINWGHFDATSCILIFVAIINLNCNHGGLLFIHIVNITRHSGLGSQSYSPPPWMVVVYPLLLSYGKFIHHLLNPCHWRMRLDRILGYQIVSRAIYNGIGFFPLVKYFHRRNIIL